MYQVRTRVPAVEVGGQFYPDTNTVVTLSNEEYSQLSPRAFVDQLTDLGFVAGSDGVKAAFVAQAAALTSAQAAALTAPATFNATFAAAEANALRTDVAALRTAYNALQADVVALRAKLNAELSALQVAAGPQASS
jgi:hypothetical protein